MDYGISHIPAYRLLFLAGGSASAGVTNTFKPGNLAVTKTVNWNGVPEDNTKTFEICIQGPSYPTTPNCKTFGYNGGLQTWSNLIPGSYTVTETDPGIQWTYQVTGSPVTVPPSATGSASVTNNRKKSTITACKKDTNSVYLAGWTINLTGPQSASGVTNDGQTGTLGCVDFVVTESGNYTLSETTQNGWSLISPSNNQHLVAVTLGQNYGSYVFENFQNAQVKVCKTDTEGDPIAGWGVSLEDDDQVTGADGCYTWTVTQPGTYTATEEARTGWTATLPITHDFVVVSGSAASEPHLRQLPERPGQGLQDRHRRRSDRWLGCLPGETMIRSPALTAATPGPSHSPAPTPPPKKPAPAGLLPCPSPTTSS